MDLLYCQSRVAIVMPLYCRPHPNESENVLFVFQMSKRIYKACNISTRYTLFLFSHFIHVGVSNDIIIQQLSRRTILDCNSQTLAPAVIHQLFRLYGLHLFAALDCLHRNGIVLGDVKPLNTVFWRISPVDPICFKLLDFGMSSVIAYDLPLPRVSSQSGTAAFRPPETAASFGTIHSCITAYCYRNIHTLL